jgi:hypothetical protein
MISRASKSRPAAARFSAILARAGVRRERIDRLTLELRRSICAAEKIRPFTGRSLDSQRNPGRKKGLADESARAFRSAAAAPDDRCDPGID